MFFWIGIEHNQKHEQVVAPDGKKRMELDFYIKPLNLAFEYNGVQHYHHDEYHGLSDKQKVRDKHKMEQCTLAGVTLIVIPYWWDKTPNSLKATIHAIRPDLLEDPGSDCVPISPNPPPGKRVSRKRGTNKVNCTTM